MISTYPPTACGLATFAEALVGGFRSGGARIDVVRIVDEPARYRAAGVTRHWLRNAPARGSADHVEGSVALLCAALNQYDVVVVQHEYGIYGGPDGEDVLALADLLTVPMVTVLHTVLRAPTARQHQILRDLIQASAAVVTMTRTARARAIDLYGADPASVHVIPHGAAADLVDGTGPAADRRPAGRGATGPTVLTWGLLGPGKGIEWGIQALAALEHLQPAPTYLIAGRTHPRVLERDGEAYRRDLRDRADRLGISHQVIFDDRYLSPAALHALVRQADVVLLPYDSVEQVTSGVLTEAVAAGKPVISTRFPHAVELLGDGAGILVDRADPAAIAAALRRVITEPDLAAGMSRRSQELAPALSWPAVADTYRRLCAAVALSPSNGSAGLVRDLRLGRAVVA
jgi:polysaccharide biosynthesis protein PslF